MPSYLCIKTNKKAAVPAKGTTAYQSQITPTRGAFAGVPYPLWDALRHARTLNKQAITGRFSDSHLTEKTLPILKGQWDNFFRHSDISGTDAYSGATATDFHRVPFSHIQPDRPDL
jgi:hypothetical protein